MGYFEMEYKVVEKSGNKYVECLPGGKRIENEKDALDLVAACGENDTFRLMLHAENLTDDFYHLNTCVAGNILLKFTTYYIKTAAVLTPGLVNQGKFYDMVLETNRGNQFRVFYEREKAEEWLVSD